MSRKRRPDEAGIKIHIQPHEQVPLGEGASEGTQQKASAEVLATRRRARVRRRPAATSAAAQAILAAAKADQTPTVNPFANVSFGATSQPVPQSKPHPTYALPASMQSKPLVPSSISPPTNQSSSFEAKVKALNNSFASFVGTQIKENPDKSWIAGVKEYLVYLDTLETTFNKKKAVSFAASTKQDVVPILGAVPPVLGTSTSTSSPKQGLFGKPPPKQGLFGKPPPKQGELEKSPTATPSLFGGDAPPSSASSGLFAGSKGGGMFGNGAVPSTDTSSAPTGGQFGAPPSSGLFGAPSKVAPPSSGLFGPPTTTPSTSTPSTSNPEEAEEKKTVALKAEAKEGEEFVFEALPCKVMVFDSEEKAWRSKGKGRLVVIQNTTSKDKHMVLRNESTGKVCFNAPIDAASAKPTRTKNKVTLTLVHFKQDDEGVLEAENGGKPSLVLISVKGEENAEDLKKAIV